METETVRVDVESFEIQISTVTENLSLACLVAWWLVSSTCSTSRGRRLVDADADDSDLEGPNL
ncbi:unnamed protein product [Dovyalis caffra]|uniref:Uncharacterized protein n=1 Tax=Dovyalis caffra TaxID=77055 RepID=A0AAV1RZD5_9ROSI|nr:unnamed protein product [Dovyalis caffra]